MGKRTPAYIQEKIDRMCLNWKIQRNAKYMIYSIENQTTYDTVQRGSLSELEYFLNGINKGRNLDENDITK